MAWLFTHSLITILEKLENRIFTYYITKNKLTHERYVEDSFFNEICRQFQKKSSQVNHSLQSYLKTSDGRLVAHLVREFLAFFDLRHTLRDSDSDSDSSYIFPSKKELKL